MRVRWALRLGVAGALVSIALQAGFYHAGDWAAFVSAIYSFDFAPVQAAGWVVRHVAPAWLPTVRKVTLFQGQLPVLAGLQWFLIGLAVDMVRPVTADRHQGQGFSRDMER